MSCRVLGLGVEKQVLSSLSIPKKPTRIFFAHRFTLIMVSLLAMMAYMTYRYTDSTLQN